MLFRKHHHSGRVTQTMHTIAGLPNFANAVVHDQPAVPGEDRWSAAADFEAFPGRYRSRQPMMRKLVDETWLKSFQGNRAVGNPDAFAIKSTSWEAAWRAFSSGAVPGNSGR